MNVMKTLDLNLKDIYQMLIAECRYGYGRNNHLMPDCAYDKVKRIVPQMYEVDKEYAVYTLKQICEECISDQLTWNFYDGEDDEHGNRAEAIKFVRWCLDWIHEKEHTDWEPYNYDQFKDNLNKDTEPRYLIYELRGKSKRRKLITPEPVSQNEYFEIMFKDVPQGVYGTYRNETHPMSDKPGDRRKSYTYHILSPFEKDFYVEHI
jgi:hypothetical protein